MLTPPMSFKRIAELRPAAMPLALALLSAASVSCSYARGDRWVHSNDGGAALETCHLGTRVCSTNGIQRCENGPDGPAFRTVEDCSERGLTCAPGLLECVHCVPDSTRCDGTNVERCAEDGSDYVASACDTARGQSCR